MKRIERIVDLYQDEEKSASLKMATCQKYYDEQFHTYTELVKYAEEYRKNHTLLAAQGISISQINNYNNFMERLRLTTDQQSLNLENAQRNLETAVQQWITSRRKKMILSKLNDKLDKESRYTDGRREQLQQDDDVAARNHIVGSQR